MPWYRWLLVVGLVLVLAALPIAGYVLATEQRDASGDAAAAKQTARAVQVSRRAAIIDACHESNRRYDNTVAAIDVLMTNRLREAPSPKERKRLRQSRKSTVLLIKQLTPKYPDCEKRADELTRAPD
jgi:hypothetical protein